MQKITNTKHMVQTRYEYNNTIAKTTKSTLRIYSIHYSLFRYAVIE